MRWVDWILGPGRELNNNNYSNEDMYKRRTNWKIGKQVKIGKGTKRKCKGIYKNNIDTKKRTKNYVKGRQIEIYGKCT